MLLGTLGFAAVAIAALAWAKWLPYTDKIPAVAGSHTVGTSIVNGDASSPPAPSW
jgi:hypothetical protein